MSDLPGNPYSYFDQHDPRNDGEIAEALRALAWEQRTANLIQVLRDGYVPLEAEDEVLKNIRKRLGVTND